VQVSGIYRAVPMREKTNARTLKSVFKTYVDVIHYRKVPAAGRMAAISLYVCVCAYIYT
jgi:hypothetical protein